VRTLENSRAVIEDPRALALLFEANEIKPAKAFEGKYCEGGKVKAIPRATKYRLLKRLAEMGYLETLGGVDKRYRFYKLSDKGQAYVKKVVKQILSEMPNLLSFGVKIPLEDFKRVSCKYGIPPSLLFKALKAKVTEDMFGKKYVTLNPIA